MHEPLAESTTRKAYIDTILDHPGPFTFAVDDEGAMLWLQFLDGTYPVRIEQAMVRLGYQPAQCSDRGVHARTQLLEYCHGERFTFSLPIRMHGSDWQRTVWHELLSIPFGETRTYGQVAARLGKPNAARAMGRANATNPVCIIVPCHRVIGAGGKLTGYDGGLHLKTRLLTHEASILRSVQPVALSRVALPGFSK